MKSRNIILLGDSTSMSVGVERKTYTFLMADASVWPERTQIVNCSLPGFTSADIAAFFFKHKELWKENIAAVVIYIGNCDSASTEVVKGRYGYLREQYNNLIFNRNANPKKTKLKNRLLHYEWNNGWDPNIEIPEDVYDFEFNVGRILKACNDRNIPVVLVRPKANYYFLPGLGKGNFIFYRFLNTNDRISQKINLPDVHFKQALKKQEDGDLEGALIAYKEILLNKSHVFMNDEYYQIVVNNYAVAKAQLGNIDEAIYLLNLLLKEREIRQEIILYNIAQVFNLCGNELSYSKSMLQSYEADHSLYRVRRSHIDALDRLSKKYPKTKVINMELFISDDMYLDHCHALPEGQSLLAEAVISSLHSSGISGNHKSDIKNMLYNPELSLGNNQSFHEYFKTFSLITENEIVQYFKTINESMKDRSYAELKASLSKKIPESIFNSIDYYLRHPCFPEVTDIVKSPPRYPSDVGRFPEYYLVRYIIPFMRAYESSKPFRDMFSSDLGLVRSSECMRNILPDNLIADKELNWTKIDAEYEKQRIPKILSKVRYLLLEHLLNKNQIFERTKSTMFWYVREALRFGAHSRYSMLYDRVLLEYLAEGLLVAGVLDHFLNLGMLDQINKLVKNLERVTLIHESYCSNFRLNRNTDSLLLKYNEELMGIAQELKG